MFPFFLRKTAIAATPSLSSSQADDEVASSHPEQRRKSISGCFFSFSLAISCKNLTAHLMGRKQCQNLGIGKVPSHPKSTPNLHSCSHTDTKRGQRTKRSHTRDVFSAVPQILGFLAVNGSFSVGATTCNFDQKASCEWMPQKATSFATSQSGR